MCVRCNVALFLNDFDKGEWEKDLQAADSSMKNLQLCMCASLPHRQCCSYYSYACCNDIASEVACAIMCCYRPSSPVPPLLPGSILYIRRCCRQRKLQPVCLVYHAKVPLWLTPACFVPEVESELRTNCAASCPSEIKRRFRHLNKIQ